MNSLSNQVQDLEEKVFAYGKVLYAVKLGFKSVDDAIFKERSEYFRILHLNKALGYCPFPSNCRFYEGCTEVKCGYDECRDGYPVRRS
jgi:hypothetical protein